MHTLVTLVEYLWGKQSLWCHESWSLDFDLLSIWHFIFTFSFWISVLHFLLVICEVLGDKAYCLLHLVTDELPSVLSGLECFSIDAIFVQKCLEIFSNFSSGNVVAS